MTGWLVKSFLKVKDPYSIVCVSGQGQGKRIIELTESDVGCNDPLIHALIGLAVTFVLTIIVATVIYRYRGHIKL